MKNIFFHFQQVGGANALLPLINFLNVDYNITISARDLVFCNLTKRGIDAIKLEIKTDTDTLLNHYSPDIVITDSIDLSRTSESIICKNIWKSSQIKNIPCIAYVDCWWAYKERFYLPGETITNLPDIIGVIDSVAQKEMLKCDFDKQHIEILGSPAYEILSLKKITQIEKKRELGYSKDVYIVIFVSQPMEKYFGSESEWGFTEKTVLKELIETLSYIPDNIKKSFLMVVLLHPEDDEHEISAIIKSENTDIKIVLSHSHRSLDYVIAGDLITGMFSILLSEAVILNRLVIPIQLNLKKQDMLITDKIGATVPVRKKQHLSSHFLKAIVNENYRRTLLCQQKKFEVVKDSIFRWKRTINRLTSRNG